MPLAQENINAFIASFISILGAECNDYLEGVEPNSLTEKQGELRAALQAIVAGQTEQNSPALQKIQFSTNFYITALCLLDPKKALPQSKIDLTQADQNQLIEEYRKKVEWYISRLDADHESQQPEQSQAGQSVIAESSTPPSAVRLPQTGTQLHDDPIMQDKTTYKSWFAYLGKEQSVILQRTYDKLLAAKNPQLIQLIKFVDEQIKMTGWNANEKKHAYLYYYHYATLTLPGPNKKINLNQKLIELEEKRAQSKDSAVPIQVRRSCPRDPILAELREIRSELRQQRLTMELNRFMWQVFLYDFYHQKDGKKHKRKDQRKDQRKDKDKNKKEDEKHNSLGALFIVVGLVLAASAGIIYGAKKAFNSASNIFHGKKLLRSLYRIGLVIVGLLLGLAVGFHFGLPALIIAAGASLVEANLLSIFIAASLGVGAGAVLAKYTAKLISTIVYYKEINPSNPEKYKLGDGQKTALESLGVNIEEFNKLMQAVRDHKKAKFPVWKFWNSWPWTESKQQKNDLNVIIDDLKAGRILGEITFNGETYDLFAEVSAAPVALENQGGQAAARSSVGQSVTFMYSQQTGGQITDDAYKHSAGVRAGARV